MTGSAPQAAPPPAQFDLQVQTLIIGAGACGLTAALRAHETGQEVLVIEADAIPAGSTALSAGLIPAAGTALQHAAGIDDSADRFAADIQAKAKGENDPALVALLAQTAPRVIDWLHQDKGLPFSVVDDFDYPGHSRRRMHGLPSRSGAELIDRLRTACDTAGIDIISQRRAQTLYWQGDRAYGIRAILPDGSTETIGADRIILATSGFGGNRDLVASNMPDITDALWFGHSGNQGEAILWGKAIGAQTAAMGAYQGHGNVAHPHGILITWAVITEGGVQVNRHGHRFWDESQGYSEAARQVLAQPGGIAFTIFDSRIAAIARQFEDFKRAEAQGAIKTAQSLTDLAEILGLPASSLQNAVMDRSPSHPDSFGRVFGDGPLSAPFCAVKVTGALFHTQGGLCVDDLARVRLANGSVAHNLYAGGGAACGVSGLGDAGYLSGNGLLAAVTLGFIAGGGAT